MSWVQFLGPTRWKERCPAVFDVVYVCAHMCACIHMHTNERINVQPIVFKKKEASCQRKTRNLSPPGLHATTTKKKSRWWKRAMCWHSAQGILCTCSQTHSPSQKPTHPSHKPTPIPEVLLLFLNSLFLFLFLVLSNSLSRDTGGLEISVSALRLRSVPLSQRHSNLGPW